jgi:hypothetical protein
MTRNWIELGRGARGRTRARRTRAGGTAGLSIVLVGVGCAQNERPDPLADVSGGQMEARVLTGSIGVLAADAGAAPGAGAGGGSGSTGGASGA